MAPVSFAVGLSASLGSPQSQSSEKSINAGARRPKKAGWQEIRAERRKDKHKLNLSADLRKKMFNNTASLHFHPSAEPLASSIRQVVPL